MFLYSKIKLDMKLKPLKRKMISLTFPVNKCFAALKNVIFKKYVYNSMFIGLNARFVNICEKLNERYF